MIDGNNYDDLTREEKDFFLRVMSVRAWKARYEKELAKLDKDAKNEERRWRGHKTLPDFDNSLPDHNFVGLMPLPQFERYIYDKIDGVV